MPDKTHLRFIKAKQNNSEQRPEQPSSGGRESSHAEKPGDSDLLPVCGINQIAGFVSVIS